MSFSLVSYCLVYTQSVTLVSFSLWKGCGHSHRYHGQVLEVIAFLLGTYPVLRTYTQFSLYDFPYLCFFIVCLPLIFTLLY